MIAHVTLAGLASKYLAGIYSQANHPKSSWQMIIFAEFGKAVIGLEHKGHNQSSDEPLEAINEIWNHTSY